MAAPSGATRARSSEFVDSAAATARLLRGRRLKLPRPSVGKRLAFADGTTSVVYRETVRVGVALADPAMLVVRFRLRAIGTRRVPHAMFRVESIANTLLFAGFPGFRSKWWMTDLDTGFYRGVYEWDGAERARAYTDRLCPLLDVFCETGTVEAHVEPGVRREPFARGSAGAVVDGAWWRPVGWVG